MNKAISPEDDAVSLFLKHRDDSSLTKKTKTVLLQAVTEDLGESAVKGRADERIDTLSMGELEIVASAMLKMIESLQQKLREFVAASVENGGDVTLAENDGELINVGREILFARHALELQQAGLQVLDQEFSFCNVQSSIETLDRELRANVQHFLCFNELRRVHGKKFPDQERFWWWHQLSTCDLRVVYNACEVGEVTVHMLGCDLCRQLWNELLAVANLLKGCAGQVRPPHPTTEELVAVYRGEADGSTERWVDRHIKCCRSCADDLQAFCRADEI